MKGDFNMPRPKGSKNKPKEETEVKSTSTRKPTPESIQKKIDSLENKKKEIDVEIEELVKQKKILEENAEAEIIFNEARKRLTLQEIEKRLADDSV